MAGKPKYSSDFIADVLEKRITMRGPLREARCTYDKKMQYFDDSTSQHFEQRALEHYAHLMPCVPAPGYVQMERDEGPSTFHAKPFWM